MPSAPPTAELARYGGFQRTLELLGVSLFAALFLLNVQELKASNPIQFLFPAFAAWIAADLLSGIAHWAFDSFGNVRTPLLGPAFIRPFREHHVDPQAMARHDFVETNGSSCLAAAPLLGLALAAENDLARSFLVFLSVGLLAANQCHKWAHLEAGALPVWVRLLQKGHFILRPQAHRLHHVPPFNRRYCTASGWLNRPLDALLSRRSRGRGG